MINLVVALVTESRPIIHHFDLVESRQSSGFRIYSSDQVRLVVSGMGRTAAAAGTAYLAAFSGAAKGEPWLNVGIAGHRDLDVGAGVHALRITDQATGRSWYPPQIMAMPGDGKALISVDTTENNYLSDLVYEMEAAPFYSTAIRFSVGELVQCYKVISDNRIVATQTITRAGISELIASHLPQIEGIVESLGRLAGDLADTQPHLNDFDHFIERWHFTVSQEHELRSLLQRWAVLAQGAPVWNDNLNRCPSAKSALAELREQLDSLPVGL